MDEVCSEICSESEKSIDDQFLKNHLWRLSSPSLSDASVYAALEATNHLLRSNLNKLINELGLNDFSAIEKCSESDSSPNAHFTTIKNIQINSETWSSYEKLKLAFSLEGDQNHWITCLLYLNYHKITVLNKINFLVNQATKQAEPLSSKDDCQPQQQQPALSLIKLLRYSNLSLSCFLKKLKKLNEILSIPSELNIRLDQLELSYNVSCVLFSKYKLIFSTLFNCFPSALYLIDQKQNGFSRTSDLFDFGWLLFINIKIKFTQIGNDLVNSYHLLLCCINLLYLNLVILPGNEADVKTYKKNLLLVKVDVVKPSNNLLIDYLCRKFDGQVIETKTINEHYFKTQLLSLIEKKIFGLRYVDKYGNSNDFFTLIDLKNRSKFLTIVSKLNKSYESLIMSNEHSKCNVLNGMELNSSFDIDERQFIAKHEHFNYNSDLSLNNTSDLDDLEDETDSHNNSLVLNDEPFVFTDRLVIPNCLLSFTKLKSEDLKSTLKWENFNFECIEIKVADLFKNTLIKEYNLNKFSSEVISSDISRHSRKKRKSEKIVNSYIKTNILEGTLKILDSLFDLAFVFYLKIFENMISSEKNRTGNENLNKLVENELIHKSVYLCCFEIVFNFCKIESQPMHFFPNESDLNINSLPEYTKIFSYLSYLTSSPSSKFKFSYFLILAELKEYEFVQIIEPFLKSTSNSPLDRDMVCHLKFIEETVLEQSVWHSNSTVWSKLSALKLNENFINSFHSSNTNNTNNSINNLVPFPLYEDVQVSLNGNSSQTHSSQQSTNNNLLNAVSSPSNSNDIILNLTPNPLTSSSSNYSSPVKHPTITRVVCAANGSMLTTGSNRQVQVLSSNSQSAKSPGSNKPIRLNNLGSSLTVFFRKFYHLANSRVRELIEKLDLVNLSIETYNNSNQNQITKTEKTNQSFANNITNNSATATPNQNFQNQQLANEFHQAILKKIWNIFEYSISIGTNTKTNLIINRHLDPLLLCSIYVICRLYSFNIQFNDVVKAYRSINPNKMHVYCDILIEEEEHSDLITFYNKIFVKTIRPCLNEINGANTVLTPNLLLTENMANQFSKKLSMTSPSNVFLSPVVPKISSLANNQQLIQFSPRKVADHSSVFVSPIKQNNSFQGVQQNRTKLFFSLKDTNPNKSMKTINEMIRKNEVKIKPNNKRLFAEISSTSNNTSTTSTTVPTNTSSSISVVNNIKSIKIEDEQDSSLPSPAKVQNMSNGLHRIASNVNNKIVVGSRIGYTSNSNNLVTMVINSSSSLLPSSSSSSSTLNLSNNSSVFSNQAALMNTAIGVGASFARKLQNIQTERLN